MTATHNKELAPSKSNLEVSFLDKSDKALLFILTLLLLVVIYLLFFKKEQLLSKETKVVGVLHSKSTIRIKRSGTLSWFSAGEGEKVYLRDMIFIPSETLSSITLDGKEVVELPEDTLIHFDEVTLENLMIFLREGVKPVSLIPRKALTMKVQKNLGDLGALIARLEELRQRTYDKVFSPRELQGVQPLNNQNIEFSLSDYEIDLITPKVGDVIDPREDKTIPFLWSKIPLKGHQFTIEISQDQSFKKLLQFTTNKGNQLYIQLDKPGQYFWRIQAKVGEEKIKSTISNFSIQNIAAERNLTNKK